MNVRNCLWMESESDLQNIFPDDLTLGLSSRKFEVGDMIIVAKDSDISFYTLGKYSATQINRPGFAVTGRWSSEKNAYPVFFKTMFSYSMQSMRFDSNMSNGFISCSTYTNSQLFCNMLTNYFPSKDIIYNLGSEESTVIDSPTYTEDTNSSTEADYLEEPGATLVWDATKVAVDGTFVPGDTLEKNTTLQTPTCYLTLEITSQWYPFVTHVRNNERLFILPYQGVNNNGQMRFVLAELAADSLSWTIHDTIDTDIGTRQTNVDLPCSSFTTAYCHDCGGPNREYFAWGMQGYTGSKPQQGYVFVIQANADNTLTKVTNIDTPVPARYGEFGRHVMIFTVDDDVHGTDVHLLVAGDTSEQEVYIFSMADGWTLKYTHDWGRNGYTRTTVSKCHNQAQVGSFIDPTSGHRTFRYNGSTYSVAYAPTTTLQRLVGPDLYASYTGSLVELREGTSYPGTLHDSVPADGYEGMHIYGSPTEAIGGLFYVMQYDSTPDNYRCLVIDPVLKTIDILWVATPSGTIGNYAGTLYMVAADRFHVFTNVHSRPFYVYERALVGGSFAGAHIFSSNNANSKISLVDGVTSILSASVTFSQPSFSSIRFAISVDDGVTWQVWESGVGFQTLSALADLVTTTYGDIGLFNTAFQGLDVVTNKNISIAFCLDRTHVSVDPQIQTSISGFSYTVDYPAEITYTLKNTQNDYFRSEVNVSDRMAIYNSTSSNSQFAIGFFDDMT